MRSKKQEGSGYEIGARSVQSAVHIRHTCSELQSDFIAQKMFRVFLTVPRGDKLFRLPVAGSIVVKCTTQRHQCLSCLGSIVMTATNLHTRYIRQTIRVFGLM